MTREEEIIQESRIVFPSNELREYQVGFELGAKWADEHPKDNLVDIDEFLRKAHIYLINKGLLHNSIECDDFDKAMKGE